MSGGLWSLWRRWVKGAAEVHSPALPPLREKELQAALCVGDEEPWWRAINQCIEVQRAKADEEALDVDNHGTPRAAYYAGAAAHLDELRRFLREQREKGLRRVDEAE